MMKGVDTVLTSRKKQGLKTKKRILEIALLLFSEKGFDNVTVDKIVDKAGVSKGAFYNHFKSKDEIFIYKFKEIDDFYEEFLKSLPDNISNRDKIIKLVEGQMAFTEEYLGRDLVRTIYINAISHRSNRTLAKKDRPLYLIVESFIEQGQKAGEFKLDFSAKETALIVTRSMRATIYDWCLFRGEFNLVKEGNKLTSLILDGLNPDK